MRNHSFKLLAFSFVLALCFSLSFSNQSRADSCLPTCDPHDSRFLTFGGQGLQTFVFELLTFGIGAPPNSTELHIRIFDGESGGHWDGLNSNLSDGLEFTLFADPNGDTTGTFQVGQWLGQDMPDNDYFDIIIPHAPEARAPVSGNYLYRMSARNIDTNTAVIHEFKIRVVGFGTSLFIFPGDQPFGYQSTCRGENTDFRAASCDIIYPNFSGDPWGCKDFFNPFCNDDPECCYFTVYDGTFDFYFFNEDPSRTVLDFWDGDLDHGDQRSSGSPPWDDTDDPNTPPGIPIFADVANTIPQTSMYCAPPDDLSDPLVSGSVFVKVPNIFYEIIDPRGVSYLNDNPSATNEWELFQLNTEPGCAPNICDYEVDELPFGIWNVKIQGMDMWNINYIRAFDKVVGVDENGRPIRPLDPVEPFNPPPSLVKNVPTFTEWGMLAVAFILGGIGIYSLRKKRKSESSSC